MVLFSQLVCCNCRKILTYPIGAISCRCRNCNVVNAAQHLDVPCGFCKAPLVVPINTLTFLCPCCATVTDIPIDLLPRLPEVVDLKGEEGNSAKTIYIENPPIKRQQSNCLRTKSIVVGTKIL